MKETTRRGGGAAGGVPAVKRKKKKAGGAGGGFMCGCGGAKSVSIVVSRAAAANISTAVTTPLTKSCAAATATSVKLPASAAKTTAAAPEPAPASQDADGTPSVDTLLRQLRELERGVRALGVRDQPGEDDVGVRARCSVEACRGKPRHHRRSASDWGAAPAAGRGRLEEESVAVVTESADPLRDFRRSMAQMVVENEITGGAELRELLQRFLSLNSARHHHLILRAFADVWEELFAAGAADHPHPLPRGHRSLPARYSTRASKLANVHARSCTALSTY